MKPAAAIRAPASSLNATVAAASRSTGRATGTTTVGITVTRLTPTVLTRVSCHSCVRIAPNVPIWNHDRGIVIRQTGNAASFCNICGENRSQVLSSQSVPSVTCWSNEQSVPCVCVCVYGSSCPAVWKSLAKMKKLSSRLLPGC